MFLDKPKNKEGQIEGEILNKCEVLWVGVAILRSRRMDGNRDGETSTLSLTFTRSSLNTKRRSPPSSQRSNAPRTQEKEQIVCEHEKVWTFEIVKGASFYWERGQNTEFEIGVFGWPRAISCIWTGSLKQRHALISGDSMRNKWDNVNNSMIFSFA